MPSNPQHHCCQASVCTVAVVSPGIAGTTAAPLEAFDASPCICPQSGDSPARRCFADVLFTKSCANAIVTVQLQRLRRCPKHGAEPSPNAVAQNMFSFHFRRQAAVADRLTSLQQPQPRTAELSHKQLLDDLQRERAENARLKQALASALSGNSPPQNSRNVPPDQVPLRHQRTNELWVVQLDVAYRVTQDSPYKSSPEMSAYRTVVQPRP